MMFENQTYENILTDLMNSVRNDIDKREGSIIYDALSPAAMKLAHLYMQLDIVLDLVYLDTATGEYLDNKAKEYGLFRLAATPAERKLIYNGTKPPVGNMFFNDNTYWELLEGEVLQCKTAGTIGNSYPVGTKLVSDNDIMGLESASLGEVVKSGSDTETDEAFRERIRQMLSEPPVNSNKAHIRQWCMGVEGVGGVKVQSLWSGPNTVRAFLIDREKQPASKEIVDNVQKYINPLEFNGLGEGMADIGCLFTAFTAETKDINIDATITIESGLSLDVVKSNIENNVKEYLKSITFKEQSVKYALIGATILNTDGVLDYTEYKLNGGTANIILQDQEVPILKSLNIKQGGV